MDLNNKTIQLLSLYDFIFKSLVLCCLCNIVFVCLFVLVFIITMPRSAKYLWIYFDKVEGKDEGSITTSLRYHLKASHTVEHASLLKAECDKKRTADESEVQM